MELVAARELVELYFTTSSASSTRCVLSGNARCSLPLQSRWRSSPHLLRREEIEATARRRFGKIPIVGTAPELVDYFGSLQERGVERIYAWFCDFAALDTLAAFGETVIGQFNATTAPSP